MMMSAPAVSRPASLREAAIDKRQIEEYGTQEVTKIKPRDSDSLFAAQWRGAFDLDVPQAPEGHSMLVWHLGGNNVSGRHNKCGTLEHKARVGEVTLQSAETPIYWRSRGSVDFLHVYLPTADLQMQTTASGLRGDVIDSLGIAFSNDKSLKSSLQALRNAAKAGPMHEMELQGWTHMIIGQVLRVFGLATPGQTKLDAKPISDAVLAQVRALVEDRIDEKITLDDMAALTGWDVYRFSRAFRNTVGQPPHQYILARRIEKARGLLADTTEPLSEIAYATGFSSQQHMTNLFSKHIGISPAKYRQGARS